MTRPAIREGKWLLDFRRLEKDQVHACEVGDWGLRERCRVVSYKARRSVITRESMTSILFSDITGRIAQWTFPERIDAVVGIATGGVVPAALVAMHLRVEMKVMTLNYRDDENEPRYPEPKLLSRVPDLGSCQRVLLVDDVYVSGKSWRAARELLPAGIEVLPFVLKGRVDFALIRDVDGCVQWPWKSY